jgi:hypothetical protein
MSLGAWLGLLVAATVLPITLTTLVSMWEKRLIWPFAPLDEPFEPTPYTAQTAALARAMGFERIGVCRDPRGGMYRVRYEFWLPPEGDALLLIGGGRLAAIPVDGSWLFTRLGDGRCLVTIDNQKASEYDLAGLRQEMLCPGLGLRALVEQHRRRAAAAQALALPFSRQDPLSEHRDMMGRRVDLLVQRGHATYLDRNAGVWRYTARGAMRLALAGHLRLWRRGLKRDAA